MRVSLRDAPPAQNQPLSSGAGNLYPAPRASISLNSLQDAMLELRSDEIDTRCAAFWTLRAVPRDYLRAAWSQVRQVRPRAGRELDCLQRVEVTPPPYPIRARRAIVTVISPGYENLLELMLHSLRRSAQLRETAVVVFVVNGAGEALREQTDGGLNELDLYFIDCQSVERVSAAIKGAIYSCARWIEAETIVSLEADMLAVGSFEPLFATLENAHPTTIAGCRAQCVAQRFHLHAVLGHHGAPPADIRFLTGEEWNAKFSFNGGLIAGGRAAWQQLDETICGMMPFAALFIEGGLRATFADEFVMNVAIAQMENRLELAPTWNVQFYDARARQLDGNRTNAPRNAIHPAGRSRQGAAFSGHHPALSL